jgi:hypothetical protein
MACVLRQTFGKDLAVLIMAKVCDRKLVNRTRKFMFGLHTGAVCPKKFIFCANKQDAEKYGFTCRESE